MDATNCSLKDGIFIKQAVKSSSNEINNIKCENQLDSVLQKFDMDLKQLLACWINSSSFCEQVPDQVHVKLKRLSNSLKYWSEKFKHLKHERLYIFTTFTLEENVRLSYVDILRNLEKLTTLEIIEEIFLPENRNYIGLYFKTVEDCNFVKNAFKKVDESVVINIGWYQELLQITGRLHYVPPFVEQYEVGQFLSKYLFNLELNKITFNDYKLKKFNSSVIVFNGILKPGIDVNFIPHFTLFKNNEVLVSIRGRMPICTKCRRKGHVRRDCSYSYCFACHSLCQKEHECDKESNNNTYADIIKKNSNNDKSVVNSEVSNKNEKCNNAVSLSSLLQKSEDNGKLLLQLKSHSYGNVNKNSIIEDNIIFENISNNKDESLHNKYSGMDNLESEQKDMKLKSDMAKIPFNCDLPIESQSYQFKGVSNDQSKLNKCVLSKMESSNKHDINNQFGGKTYSKPEKVISEHNKNSVTSGEASIFSIDSADLVSSDAEEEVTGSETNSDMDTEGLLWKTIKRKNKSQFFTNGSIDEENVKLKHVKVESSPIKTENSYQVLTLQS